MDESSGSGGGGSGAGSNDPADDGDAEWPNGLVAVGGTLDPDALVAAYSAGIFPWSSDPVLTWWSPDPRAIFDLESWRAHRTVWRSARRAGWRFSVDHAFEDVMRACGEASDARPSTWITDDFVRSYAELHRRGRAHSIEVWEGEVLVGGLYGVALGGFFGGESMFHRRTDASKVAVAYLIERMRAGGFSLLDAQVPTPHLERLGAVSIPRADYLDRLRAALRLPARLVEGEPSSGTPSSGTPGP